MSDERYSLCECIPTPGVRVVCDDVFEAPLELGAHRLVYADPPYTEDDYFGYGGFAGWPRLIERMIELGAPDAAYVLHMGVANLSEALPAAEALAPKRRRRGAVGRVRVLAWVKPWGAWRPGLTWQYQWEPILVWYGPKFSQPASVSYKRERDWFECPPWKPKWGHPTEKPPPLLRWVFDRLLVGAGARAAVDLFAGSGTAAVMAARYGMEAVAVEKEPDYADVIVARAAAETMTLLTAHEAAGVQGQVFELAPSAPGPGAQGLGRRNRRAGAHLDRGKGPTS